MSTASLFTTGVLVALLHLIPSSLPLDTFTNPLDLPLQHLVVDRRYSGRVYVSGVNRLYQLSSDLTNQVTVETGPQDDSPLCPVTGECPPGVSRSPTQNYPKALAISYRQSKLISCGSIGQGKCQLRNLYNITRDSQDVNEAVVPNDRDSTCQIFVAPGPPDPQKDEVLYVGSTYSDNGNYRDEVPAVASRSLQGTELFKIAFKAIKYESQLSVERSRRKQFKIDYIGGFASGNFSYFLIRQQKLTTGPSKYISKLVRLCQKDRSYYSYTEIPLECSTADGVHFNLIQDGFVDRPGYDLAEKLGISTDDDVLFGVFTRGEGEPLYNQSSRDSALCVYSLKSIEDKFIENIQLCSKGEGNRGLDHFKSGKPCAKVFFSSNADITCGTEVNYPLGGDLPVSATPALTYSGGSVMTSVVTAVSHHYTVAFVGTTDGQVIKAVIDSPQSGVEFGRKFVSNLPILADMNLDMSGEFLFALTEKAVFKLPTQECSAFSTCRDCLNANDPYCGWCSNTNKCSTKETCDNGKSTNSSWLPYKDKQCATITQVQPAQIQISATQYILISVQNLPGSAASPLCVFSLGGKRLATSAERNNGETISCSTPPTHELPHIPAGEHYLESNLSIQLGDTKQDYAVTNFTFFDCSTFASCTSCTASRFPCDWCVHSHLCTQNFEVKCREQHIITGEGHVGKTSRRGPTFCPAILPLSATETPEILVASGQQKSIELRSRNLQDFQSRFTCEFTIDNSIYKAKAERTGLDSIRCDKFDFRYFDAQPNTTAKLAVTWDTGKPLDNPQEIKVLIYKCAQMARSCGECLSVERRYECGWCATGPNLCSTKADCSQPNDHWLDAGQICPNPKILRFSPAIGPLEGGSRLVIEGLNLMSTLGASDYPRITVNAVPCQLVPDAFRDSTRLSCETGASVSAASGPIVITTKDGGAGDLYTAVSGDQFAYVQPSLSTFSPSKGPQSGGTLLTLTGSWLDAGTNVSVKLGPTACVVEERQQRQLKCRTREHPNSNNFAPVQLRIDRFEAKLATGSLQFYFASDPQLTSVSPDKTIASGGLIIGAFGDKFDLLQTPRLLIRPPQGELAISPPCRILSPTQLECLAPPIPALIDAIDADKPVACEFGFQLDGMKTYANLSALGSFPQRHVLIYSDPTFYPFPEVRGKGHGQLLKFYKADQITIEGKNIDLVASDADFRVYVGRGICNVTGVSKTLISCRPPPTQPRPINPDSPGGLPEVLVSIGYRNYSVGYLSYEEMGILSILSKEVIIGIAVCAVLFIVLTIGIVIGYRRKSTRHLRQMRNLKEQIDAIEMKVASECKEAFAELQTDMTDLTADNNFVPFLSYRDYVIRVLFPNTIDPPALHELDVEPGRKPQLVTGLNQFSHLVSNKQFLLTFVRTMEANKYFLSKDRVYVGSLLMVILQDKMEFCTEILKALLSDLIAKAVDRPSQPKILFRRSESVAERMLAAWYSFLMYRYLQECGGQPLYTLYLAIKQQVEKGPQDALTHEARYSLSEEKLIRQAIPFEVMTIFVLHLDGSLETAVRVLNCDTIGQVKEKVLDAIYKITPFSRRPSAEDLDLEWRTGVSGRLILQNLDMTTKSETGDWKKLNTLAHYKVPNNSHLALVPKQAAMFNLSLSSERSDRTNKSFSTFSLKNSPTMTRLRGGDVDHSDRSGTNPSASARLFHLVRPTDPDPTAAERNGKLMAEIYLTRLLTAKGTLQKFLEDFYETIFSTNHGGTPLPICIKFMFDFMDEQAERHGLNDPDIPHTWKSNSLPLRFWVNLIKNPNFLFDIPKPTKIEGSLSVVAQTLMDSCSTKDHPLTKDSPSSKLLFAKDILVYRDWVDRYYYDIAQMPSISDQDMSACLADESRQHQRDFDAHPALYELFKYVRQYRDQILENLESDEMSRRSRLGSKFIAMMKAVEGVEPTAYGQV